MKKIIALCIVVLLINLINITCIAADKVVVDDTFENFSVGDSTPGGWAVSPDVKAEGSYGEIVTDPSNPDNKVLLVAAHGGSGQKVAALRNFDPIGGIINVSYRVRFQSADIHHLADVNGVMNLMPYQGQFCINSAVKAGWPVPNIGVQYDTWYTIEYRIDTSEKKFTIRGDGATWIENEPFSNVDTESVKALSFSNSAGDMYIDDVKVSYSGGIVKNYLKISAPKYRINANNKMIMNIPYETETEEFMKNITFVDGAIYELRNADGTAYTGRYITDRLVLNIASPIVDDEVDYILRVRPWVASRYTAEAVNGGVAFSEKANTHIAKGKRCDNGIRQIDGVRGFPLRAICEGFGIPIDYDDETATVYVNNAPLENPQILDGVTYVDESYITRELKKVVVFDYDGVVVIKDSGISLNKKIYKTVANEISERLLGGEK